MSEIARITTEVSIELQTAVELHNRILTNGALAAQALVEFTKGLKQMRDEKLYIQLGYEDFENYVEQAVGIKQRQAYTYISSLEKLGDKAFNSVSHLGITKIELLTGVPLVEREEFIEQNDIESMSTKQLREAIEKINGYEEQIALLTNEKQSELEKKNSEIEKLKKQSDTLKQKDTEIKQLRGKVKELESKPTEIVVEEPSVEIMASIRAEAEKNIKKQFEPQLKELENVKKEKAELQQKADELSKKLKITGNKETAEFSVYFEQAKTAINKMIETADKVAETDEDTAQRLKTAVLRFAQQMVEIVSEV